MSDDPLIERLTQFTPDGGRLDRDALLFAAGRASVRPSRGWRALAAALAASQLLTMTLILWPREAAPAPEPHWEAAPIVTVTPTPSTPEPLPPISEGSGTWALLQLLESNGKLPLPETFEMAASADRHLSAFGPWPADLRK
jgi:hypothetical protein